MRCIPLVALLLFVSGAAMAQGQEDCAAWKVALDSVGHEDARLGMPLSALWGPEKRGHRSGPRYFDNLKVNSYVGQQYSLETLGCPDGGEIIVGIAFGEYAAERKTVGEFLKSEEASLKATGVTTVTQQLNGRDLYLWGIQSRVTRPGAGGIADYTVLRRLCRRYVAGGVETCSAISRQVHLVRSMAKVY